MKTIGNGQKLQLEKETNKVFGCIVILFRIDFWSQFYSSFSVLLV